MMMAKQIEAYPAEPDPREYEFAETQGDELPQGDGWLIHNVLEDDDEDKRWVTWFRKKRSVGYLVGPLSNIVGIGPKSVDAILDARKTGKPLPSGLAQKLVNPKTAIDSLYPISDRIKELHPDLTAIGITSQ